MMKALFAIFMLALLQGCASVVVDTQTWKKHYNPKTDARIRILAKEKNLKREHAHSKYHTYKYRVMTKENGQATYYGFKPSLLSLNATNIRIGMPDTLNSEYCLDNKTCYMREFIVSANQPVYIGRGTQHWCDDAWFFPDCYSRTYNDVLVPKAGSDYEIINAYHVYKINKDGSKEKINTDVTR